MEHFLNFHFIIEQQMKVSTFFTLLLALFLSSFVLAEFKDGDDGKVSWDLDCDYPGNDIGNNKTLSTKCGKLCIDNPNCKYFAWSSGICYLKNRHDKKQFFDGSVCGFVKDRVKNATELTISWKMDCDYPGNDIAKINSPSTNCGQLCLGNPNCRYFAWSSGTCYLKSRHDSKTFFGGSVCGFIKERVFK